MIITETPSRRKDFDWKKSQNRHVAKTRRKLPIFTFWVGRDSIHSAQLRWPVPVGWYPVRRLYLATKLAAKLAAKSGREAVVNLKATAGDTLPDPACDLTR